MISRLLFVRLKAAENALRDGRIDEAYRLATAADIREHRRGAAVLSALTERFIERARQHFRADRFTEALMDLDRAEAGGVMKSEIAELRQHVQTVAAEQQRRERSRRGRLEAAKQRIEDGSLSGGRRILDRAGENDLDAGQLRGIIEERAEKAAALVEQAENLISQGQIAAAARRLRQVRSIDAHHEAAARAATRLCNQVLDNARAAIIQGRLSRASDELACLGDLGDSLPAKRELSDLLAIAREAARCVQTGRYVEARRYTMSLERLLPEADWIREAVEQLRRIDEVTTALKAGPLGNPIERDHASRAARENARDKDARNLPLQSSVYSPGAEAARAKARGSVRGPVGGSYRDPLNETVALPAGGGVGNSLPDRLLLLVDGGGSYLLLRTQRASIGRVAAANPADVPIYSDVAEQHANISRMEDDYFLFSAREVEVAGRKTKHHLLRDGDRIVLGRKAKLTFRLPSLKSSTAVLDLSDTTKMPNDVRRVILFHRHAMVGADVNAHIRCRHAGIPVVLFERNGALWMRLKNDGHVDTEPVRLAIGEPVEIAGVSLVLEPWEVRTPGSKQV